MIFQPPAGNDNGALAAWARRLVDEINRFLPTFGQLPVFADDNAAAVGRVKVGDGYVTPEGIVRRRMS